VSQSPLITPLELLVAVVVAVAVAVVLRRQVFLV
jgi:hypothetical protein